MKSDVPTDADGEFSGKYTKSGRFGRALVDGFFGQLVQLVAPLHPSSALEVGCGHGYSTERLARALPGTRLEASDYVPELVADARLRNPGVPVTEESIYSLQRPSDSFDLVMALEVLEHLTDPAAALAELARVTNRYCVVSVPREPLWRVLNLARGAYWRGLGNTPGHLNHWSSRSFERFVGGQFKVIAVRKPLPWTVVLAEKRQDADGVGLRVEDKGVED